MHIAPLNVYQRNVAYQNFIIVFRNSYSMIMFVIYTFYILRNMTYIELLFLAITAIVILI